MPKLIHAGGAVVTREGKRGTEVLVVHRPGYRDWSLPKGKLDPDEHRAVAAVREVWEETGVRVRLGVPLDQATHPTGAGPKQVSWWGGVVLSATRRAPDREVDVVSWLPTKAALARLSYDADKALVRQHLDQPTTVPVLLVRHAKAMDRKNWKGRDPSRPVSARGRRQARQLVPLLGAYGVETLVSSSSNRCVSTLLPYATRHGLTIDRHTILTEEEGTHGGDSVTALVEAVRARAVESGTPAVICCHRPVLPHILAAMGLPDRPLSTAETVVAHVDATGHTHAVERHRTHG
ncbi:MAG: NUDIX hydrolase [Propionibacteriaceae bacterium]